MARLSCEGAGVGMEIYGPLPRTSFFLEPRRMITKKLGCYFTQEYSLPKPMSSHMITQYQAADTLK
jgi:hypothetical protein